MVFTESDKMFDVDFILGLISLLIPKRVGEWIKKQNELVRKILYVVFWIIALSLAILLTFLLWCVFVLIANGIFGCDLKIYDFPDSWSYTR